MQKSINFLTFWGRLDYYSACKLPTYKRNLYIDWTHENLKILFGKGDK
jgi:hypothetical protein